MMLNGRVIACIGLALAPSGMVRAGDDLPVVFVPGTAGSRLVEVGADGTRRQLWIAPRLLNDGVIDKASLGPGGATLEADGLIETLRLRASLDLTIVDEDAPKGEKFQTKNLLTIDRMTYPVYGNFLGWLEREWPGRWYTVPYDWRKGASDASAAAIEAQVKKALDKSGKEQVVLVAHSLGGLACRDYILRGENARKVRALIAVGTPWLGAPKAARGLRWGYNFGLGGPADPPETMMVEGVIIYYKDDNNRQQTARYRTLVSLLDPVHTRPAARSFPCVYQQLPTRDFMKLYGEALNREETSIFLGETVSKTIAYYESIGRESKLKVGRDLYREATEWREGRLKGQSTGVGHYLVAGVCDPDIEPYLATDMRMATTGGVFGVEGEDGPSPGLFWFGEERVSKGETFLRFWAWFDSLRDPKTRPDHIMVDFFKINPTLHDFGNLNWHIVRLAALASLREGKNLPIYHDPYVAIDTDSRRKGDTAPQRRWGDGGVPLLSASAGAQLDFDPEKADQKIDPRRADRWLGEGTVVDVLMLSKYKKDGKEYFYEHSCMLDDPVVLAAIRKDYAAACARPPR